MSLPASQLVANAFSHSAHSYDQAAVLQTAVGDKLLSLAAPAGVCLDLGCGTGRYTQAMLAMGQVNQCYALDIAAGMLARTAQQVPKAEIIQANARAIPLADNSVDYVFSSLMLQWLGPDTTVFKEIKRVLKPGGYVVFSTLLQGTLYELEQAWLQVDRLRHVNEFAQQQAWQQAVCEAGFEAEAWLHEPYVRRFDTVRAALLELKALGAHNVNHDRPKAMMGKQKFAAFVQAYEGFRTVGHIPATYQVLYGVLRG